MRGAVSLTLVLLATLAGQTAAAAQPCAPLTRLLLSCSAVEAQALPAPQDPARADSATTTDTTPCAADAVTRGAPSGRREAARAVELASTRPSCGP